MNHIGIVLPRIKEAMERRCLYEYDEKFIHAVSSGGRYEVFNSCLKYFHGDTAVKGWRERIGRWATQVILHMDASKQDRWLEVDVDCNNPNFGLYHLIGHGINILTDKLRVTDTMNAFKVMEGLRNTRGIKVKDIRQLRG